MVGSSVAYFGGREMEDGGPANVSWVAQCFTLRVTPGSGDNFKVRPTYHLTIPPKSCSSVQVTPVNVDISKVAPTYHLYTEEEVQEVIDRL